MSSKLTSNAVKVLTWSHKEDTCLARAWCTFRDSFKNTDPRKIEEFWETVAAFYNENRPVESQMRSWDAVNAHCFHMMLDVNLLSDMYEKCYSDRSSGQSVDDVLEVALAQWRNKYSKDFKYAHVWKIMTELEIDGLQQPDHHAINKSRTNHANKKSRTNHPQQFYHEASKKSRANHPQQLDDHARTNHPQQLDHEASKKLRANHPQQLDDHAWTNHPQQLDHEASKKLRANHPQQLDDHAWTNHPQQLDDHARTNQKSRTNHHPQQLDRHANKKSRTLEPCGDTCSESEVRVCAMEQQRVQRQGEIEVESCCIGKCRKMQQIQEGKKKQKEIKLMHKDFDIIMLDTSGMTDAQRQVHSKFVEQIRARRNW